MKKLFLLLSIISIVLFSCKKTQSVIGISKIVSHPALDSVEKGVIDQLQIEGYKDLVFDVQNANGEPATANQIALKFKSNKVKIAVGIATPTAQALVTNLKDIPVVFSAVTDPVGAGLVQSLEKGENNVTGVSDMTPVKVQIEMFVKIANIKKLGHIYSSNESNSITILNILKDVCKANNIELIEASVTNSSEVKQAVLSIIKRVDGIYISTDNTVVSAISSVIDVANQNNKPVFSADPTSSKDIGVLGAYGFNYYQIGLVTGTIVSRLLKGEKCENIPTVFMNDPKYLDLLINIDVAKKLNINIPDDIMEKANIIIENGKITEKNK